MDLPSGTVTFFFSDVVGSTRLWEAAPASMGTALARHDQILRAAVDAHRGYVFATGGDGFAAGTWQASMDLAEAEHLLPSPQAWQARSVALVIADDLASLPTIWRAGG